MLSFIRQTIRLALTNVIIYIIRKSGIWYSETIVRNGSTGSETSFQEDIYRERWRKRREREGRKSIILLAFYV